MGIKALGREGSTQRLYKKYRRELARGVPGLFCTENQVLTGHANGTYRLQRRPETGVYYYRHRIPADILYCYSGSCEVICSLRIKSYQEAIQRLRVKLSAIAVEWEAHRQHKADQAAEHQITAVTVLNTLSDEAIETICHDLERGALDSDEMHRLSDHLTILMRLRSADPTMRQRIWTCEQLRPQEI